MTQETAQIRKWLQQAALAAVIILLVSALAPDAVAVTGLDKIQSLGGGRYLAAEEQSVSARGQEMLLLSSPPNLSGHIVMTVQRTDSVVVSINKVLRVESAQIAADLDAEIRVDITRVDKMVRIDIHTPSGAPWEGTDWGVTLDLEITVPPAWDLDFDTRYFEYDLTGPFRDVRIVTEFGRVKLSKVTRRTDVRGSYTSIELAEVKGEISSRTSYADLDVRQAISEVEHPVRLANSNGAIKVVELAGAVVAETEYAPITLEKISLVGSTSRIMGNGATVNFSIVEFGRARLEIESGNSPVRLQVPSHLSARLNVSVGNSGTIRTSGLEIQTHPDLLGHRRLEGTCGAGDGVIDIRATGASLVEIAGR
jgi:hypothetical protein